MTYPGDPRRAIPAPAPFQTDETRVGHRGYYRPTIGQIAGDVKRQTLSGLASAGIETVGLPLTALRLVAPQAPLPGPQGLAGSLATLLLGHPYVQVAQSLLESNREEMAAYYGKPMTTAGWGANLISNVVGGLALGNEMGKILTPVARAAISTINDPAFVAAHLNYRVGGAVRNSLWNATIPGTAEVLPGPLYRAQLARFGLWHGSKDPVSLLTSVPGKPRVAVDFFGNPADEKFTSIISDEMGQPVVRMTPDLREATGYSSQPIVNKVRLTDEASQDVRRLGTVSDLREWQRAVNTEVRARGLPLHSYEKYRYRYSQDPALMVLSSIRAASSAAAKRFAEQYSVLDARGLSAMDARIVRELEGSGQLFGTKHGSFSAAAAERQVAIQHPEAIRDITAHMTYFVPRRFKSVFEHDFGFGSTPEALRTVPIARTTYSNGEPIQIELLPISSRILKRDIAKTGQGGSVAQHAGRFQLQVDDALRHLGFDVRYSRGKVIYTRPTTMPEKPPVVPPRKPIDFRDYQEPNLIRMRPGNPALQHPSMYSY